MFLIFFQKKVFLIFRKRNFLIFSLKKFFLFFGKIIFRTLAYSEPEAYSDHYQISTIERIAKQLPSLALKSKPE